MKTKLFLVIILIFIAVTSAYGQEPNQTPPTPTPPLTPRQQAEIQAAETVTANADWIPFSDEVNGVEMVLVPVGCFRMGNEEQPPVHNQCFEDPFWIGKYEVTNAEYAAFVEADGYENADYWTLAGWEWKESENISAANDSEGFTAPDQPRVGVSWYEAYAYANWRGCRLSTEAEWEYAASGPSNLVYPWGDEFVADNLVYDGNSGDVTAEVGSIPAGASWVGALDLSGNVWEWTNSIAFGYPYRADDGREEVEGNDIRTVRGGSWGTDQEATRAAHRDNFFPDDRNFTYGFRIACDSPAP